MNSREPIRCQTTAEPELLRPYAFGEQDTRSPEEPGPEHPDLYTPGRSSSAQIEDSLPPVPEDAHDDDLRQGMNWLEVALWLRTPCRIARQARETQ